MLPVLVYLLPSTASGQHFQPDSIVADRLQQIIKGLDTLLFVKRFESVETACLCIDSSNPVFADRERRIINSNYKIRLKLDHLIDSGVSCLSNYYARYARLRVKEYNEERQEIFGTVEFTYGYPASSIIQYLGMKYNAPQRDGAFFETMFMSTGTFCLYPDNDKYSLQIAMDATPYDKGDTLTAFLEISKNAFSSREKTGYMIYFEEMSLRQGDRNNQIFLRFTSTSFRDESMYYAVMMYHVLKYLQDPDKEKQGPALWLKSFFDNSKCPSCKFIYAQAAAMVNGHITALPNTEPFPAH